MPPALLERLHNQLRRDPLDADVAFLVSLAARVPLVLYPAECVRLRRLGRLPGRSAREQLIVDATGELLALAGTPSAGLRRPEPGAMDVVNMARLPAFAPSTDDDEAGVE